MLELLSPAGSKEALTAAVQNGADAVYLGLGDFNARRGAKNFTEADLAPAVEYCHVRGVKVYLTMNTLLTDRELPAAARQALLAAEEPIHRYSHPIPQAASCAAAPVFEPAGEVSTQVLEQLACQSQLLVDLLGAVNSLTAALLCRQQQSY